MILQSILTVFFIGAASALYDKKSDVIELTAANFKSKVVNSDDVWIVEFYAPWCGHCKSLAPEYAKAAKALKGFVKVGAVNVDEERSLGSEYGVQGFPTIKIFGGDKKKPEDYNGARTADGIISSAFTTARQVVNSRIGKKSSSSGSSGSGNGGKKGKVGDDVIHLDDNNFEELVLNSDEPWLVEFFAPWCGHCKNLAPEWAKAATELKGHIKLGAYDADSQKMFAGRYQIRGFPTIKYFPTGRKDQGDVIDYDGARNADGIVQWAKDKVSENLPAPEVVQITSKDSLKAGCEEHPLCIVSVLPHILDCNAKCRNAYIEDLQKLGDKFKKQQWGWLWTEAAAYPELEESIGLGGFGYPALAMVSTKKGKYSVLRGPFSYDGINSFLREITAGRGSTVPIKGSSLPEIPKSDPWDGKDGQMPVEEDLNLDDVELDPLPKSEL